MHEPDAIRLPELDFDDALWLEHTPAGHRVGDHLDAVSIDLRVDHHPRTPPELRPGGQVYHHGGGVRPEGLDDARPALKNAGEKVRLPSGEASPVAQDDEGNALPGELLQGSGRLEGAVWVPDLAGLVLDDLGGGVEARVSRDLLLDCAGGHEEGEHYLGR